MSKIPSNNIIDCTLLTLENTPPFLSDRALGLSFHFANDTSQSFHISDIFSIYKSAMEGKKLSNHSNKNFPIKTYLFLQEF